MGTLTADVPRLAEHCAHKLPASCRLTADPRCCACQDTRPHSSTYRVYLDGIGFVQRGTRWQGYCWYCQEFWNNRLAATTPRMEPSQTRIPEIPDQTRFVERWFEFHQGYRIVKGPDGTERRVAVLGEPLHEVSPGCLPRTLDELRAGVPRSAEDMDVLVPQQGNDTASNEPHVSLEDALDSLMNEESDNDTSTSPRGAPHALSERSQPPATNQGIPAVEPHAATDPSADEPREHREWSQIRRTLLSSDSPRHRATLGERLARALGIRALGTREEVQQEDYQSPIGSMFNRAWERYQRSEELRREVQHHASSSGGGGAATISSQLTPSELHDLLLHGYRPPESAATTTDADGDSASTAAAALPNEHHTLTPLTTDHPSAPRSPSPPPTPNLDNDPTRPPPLTDAQMTVTLRCQVCYAQRADVACLPCGHLVLCRWCAAVALPARDPVRLPRIPRDGARATCPLCRRRVRERVRIFWGGGGEGGGD